MKAAAERGLGNKEGLVKQKEGAGPLADKAIAMQNNKVKNIKHYGAMPAKA